MPGKAIGPARQGAAWDAFVRYWAEAIDDNGSKSVAWRAFHAGYLASQPVGRTNVSERPYVNHPAAPSATP